MFPLRWKATLNLSFHKEARGGMFHGRTHMVRAFTRPCPARRLAGSPRLGWIDNVRQDALSLGIRNWQFKVVDQWRNLVKAAVRLQASADEEYMAEILEFSSLDFLGHLHLFVNVKHHLGCFSLFWSKLC